MPNPAAPSSVLLLGWDDTTPALPLARTLATTVTTELWTAAPLPTVLPTAARRQQHSLDVMPPAPALALGHQVPAFPYVGRGVGQPLGLEAAAGRPVAVPAAPYIGSSEAPPAYSANPAGPVSGAIARTSFAGANRPVGVPAAPYVGATHEEAPHPEAAQPLRAAPVPDYRVPVAALPAGPTSATSGSGPDEQESAATAAPLVPAVSLAASAASVSSPTADAPASGAEPGPAEATELRSETTTGAAAPGAMELLPNPPADSAPTPAAELLPGPPAAFDDAELDAEDVALLAAGAANDAADLNFRIIEYARHAARRAYESEFEVIFAPDWHTWLAGVELRQLTRRPLVLQVAQLATDLATTPAERGWMEALERITLPQADRILVPDEATAARLRQRYRHLASRVYVLPAGAPELAAALVLDSRFSR